MKEILKKWKTIILLLKETEYTNTFLNYKIIKRCPLSAMFSVLNLSKINPYKGVYQVS